MITSSMIPKGALSFNPKLISDDKVDTDLEHLAEKGSNDEKMYRSDSDPSNDRRESVTRVDPGQETLYDPDVKPSLRA